MLVRNLIKAAYANLGVTDLEQGPTAAQYEQGLQALNSMLGAWSRDRQTIYGLFDESFALTIGKAAYTVGTGGELNTAWAFEIQSAYYTDANGIDYPLQVVSPDQYERIPLKTTETRPRYLLYNPKGYPTGTATLYPVPDQAYTLHWTAQKVLTSYASIDATVGIAPEYEEAIEYNLSVRLAPKCRVPVSAEIAALARQSKAVIPVVIEPAQFDGAFNASNRYNIYSDDI